MLKILEIAWLCIAVFTLVIAAYQFFTDDISSALFMLVGTVIATAMFMIRRKQRRRYDNFMQEQKSSSETNK